MKNFAVLDIETTWDDDTMSIGIVIANEVFEVIDKAYFLLTPYCNKSGMYSDTLYIDGIDVDCKSSREYIINEIECLFINHHVLDIFAYNAKFDYRHLPELSSYNWFDIMKIAAYKQHNKHILDHHECCKSGRLKSKYGVENIYKLISGNDNYGEKHNALTDAIDELEIMKLLEKSLLDYNIARIN